MCIFVDCKTLDMERINIYSGKEIISRIVVSDGLDALKTCLEPYEHVFVVADIALKRCSAVVDKIKEMQKGRNAKFSLLEEVSETAKTMDTVMDICSWLQAEGADRDGMVLAVGGGITTDMVGFAASIYKRGVRFAHVPTTLLAQVDAAIGGKTGVNFEKYKNILGVIRQPEFTYLCPQVLETLPQRDFLSGAAEMIKTFIIEDGGNYEKTVDLLWNMSMESDTSDKTWPCIVRDHLAELQQLISAAARVKAGVVSRDQFEGGERRKLNLGHTFAHAVETLAQRGGGDITHGEAVAMGLIFAARLSDRICNRDEESSLAMKIETELWDCNVPCYCPYSIEEMAGAMAKDKKAEGGKIHFVIPRAVGDVTIEDLTVEEAVRLLK